MSVEYDSYLDEHRANVFKGYEWLMTNIPDVIPSDSNLEWLTGFSHDLSKNSVEEYDAYDAYFYGNERTPDVVRDFNYAWLHHIHNNPHHWQYWILRNDDPNEGETVLEMPTDYALEMICDWWAFSFSKGNLTEIFGWYDEHKEYIKLHTNTRKFVEDTLSKIKSKLK